MAINPRTTDELMAIIRCAIDNYAPKWEKGRKFELHVEVEIDELPVVTINGKYGILPKQWRGDAE